MGIRETLHLGGEPEQPADPNHPHPFKRAGEHWLGGGVPPSNTVSGPNAGTAMGSTIAGLQFADQHCAVCRRGHDDPIHAPAEE